MIIVSLLFIYQSVIYLLIVYYRRFIDVLRGFGGVSLSGKSKGTLWETEGNSRGTRLEPEGNPRFLAAKGNGVSQRRLGGRARGRARRARPDAGGHPAGPRGGCGRHAPPQNPRRDNLRAPPAPAGARREPAEGGRGRGRAHNDQ